MKLTARSEYALLALVLEQLMLALKRAHFLHSAKGQHGGYALAKAPIQITLAEIIRLFDGALAPTESVSENFYESTPIEKEQSLVLVFKDIRDYISNKLEQTTLADVIK
jgi:Rrf2 family cysteine metabolism transcriptional repressor